MKMALCYEAVFSSVSVAFGYTSMLLSPALECNWSEYGSTTGVTVHSHKVENFAAMSNRYFYVFFERYVGEEWVAVERSTIFPEHLVH